jgi:2-keto-4-pentenoate hydratase/2-oxohepta-3-ene-1,7-dioic acid hydratase in catechol pathway
MKLATFEINGNVGFGVVLGNEIFDLTQAGLGGSLREYIAGGPGFWQKAAAALQDSSCPRMAVPGVHWLAPVLDPAKVVAIGLNYKDHAAEQNIALPKAPLIFAKFSSSITGPYDPIRWDPALTRQVDYEVELGVVIGRRARRVSEADALDYVFGYTIINDVSARDLQFGDKQWVRGKSLDTFCPMGPVVVTSDEIPDPQALDVRCLVNGRTMQNSNTAQMVFGVRQLIAHCSQAFTLEPGDLIATGTPSGVGTFRNPPFYLQDGDVMRTEIDAIGYLENVCKIDRA